MKKEPPNQIHWTLEERVQVAARAKTIKEEYPELAWANIIQVAQDVLPIARRRFNFAWSDALRPIFKILNLDEQGSPLPPTPPSPPPIPPPVRAAAPPPPKQAAPPPPKQEPELVARAEAPDLSAVPTSRVFMEALARGQEFIDQINGVFDVVHKQRAAQEAFEQRVEAAVKDALLALGKCEEKIKEYDRRITASETLVLEELDKLGHAKPPPSQAAPPPSQAAPPLSLLPPTAAVNGKSELKTPEPKSPPLPRPSGPPIEILLVGPRPDDFQFIRQKVRELHVELTMLDKRADHVSDGYDYVLISQKFGGRYWHEAHQKYGRRALSVPGGSSNIIQAIENCVLVNEGKE
jgi:hypothetical protein